MIKVLIVLNQEIQHFMSHQPQIQQDAQSPRPRDKSPGSVPWLWAHSACYVASYADSWAGEQHAQVHTKHTLACFCEPVKTLRCYFKRQKKTTSQSGSNNAGVAAIGTNQTSYGSWDESIRWEVSEPGTHNAYTPKQPEAKEMRWNYILQQSLRIGAGNLRKKQNVTG